MQPKTSLRAEKKNGLTKSTGSWAALGTILLVCSLALVVQICSSGCSSRSGTQVANADSTWVYPAKDSGGIEANIVFCAKTPSKKTGQRRNVRDTFRATDKAKVYAFVDLENQFALGDRPLDFHLVWIGPNQKSFYKKRIEYLPTDSTSTLRSRITLPPARREAGTYSFRVYFFRELIAERSFEVTHPDEEGNG
jgi:hypothetical protein